MHCKLFQGIPSGQTINYKLAFILVFLLVACNLSQNNNVDRLRAEAALHKDTGAKTVHDTAPAIVASKYDTAKAGGINTTGTRPEQLMQFAEQQIGVRYVYGSSDPKVGFDCSGFITYVFNHFNIQVPRSSAEFTSVGQTVPVTEARRGDIILFTGTDSMSNEIGHMGLITENNNGTIKFIHSTSGRQMGVTITVLDDYYRSRFMRVARVFG